ncbi:probable flavin-containing monooxygenase 1 [Phtheirospermum japonicum]|uniref:Flavin-containing monooxygenase n=1 Tax=Phtheirospermum japonicum TaxID=374723 RepID=A0A830CGU7_9LAMI|nr:probable flavin-containing monooxygenase 1 [Phtheirospermum japonicum]
MEKRVAIVGAGISGLLACKYAASKGLNPVVFEAQDQVGGLWNHTIESTRLQIPKETFQFSDFPWPSSADTFPHNTQLRDYLQSYAQHFQILQYIQFNSKVISIDYVGHDDDMQFWELWGGAGKAFGSKGKWHLKVIDTKQDSIKEYVAEFVVLCIGRFSGLPDIPEFPSGCGPDVFSGKVLHSMDFAAMDNASAAELIKGKKVAIIGSAKSAVDIAFECSNANGNDNPCMVIQRTVHWMLPDPQPWGVSFGFLCFSRFSELCLHKPGEGLFSSVVATMLSPLLFFLPENFYDKVEDGSIVFEKSQKVSFCREGLILDGEESPLKADIVILATGYKGDEKLKNIFASTTFQNWIEGSPTSIIPLYRQMIHPRIPQLAVIGYSESLSNLFIFEMRSKWLAFFLDEAFQLPSIKEMERDIKSWDKYMKKYAGNGKFRRSCIGGAHIWYIDQLCKDIGINPRRKKGVLSEFFEPYGIEDYLGLGP